MAKQRRGPDADGRPLDVAGTCPSCGAVFAGEPGTRAAVAAALSLHGGICPGGERVGEVVTPFAAGSAGQAEAWSAGGPPGSRTRKR